MRTFILGTAYVDADTGENSFTEDPSGLHKYVIKKRENDYYKTEIDSLLER